MCRHSYLWSRALLFLPLLLLSCLIQSTQAQGRISSAPANHDADVRALNNSAGLERTCGSALLECLSGISSAKAQCLHRASTASDCLGTPLGKIGFKRFLMDPDAPIGNTESDSAEAHAFLGSAGASQKCLNQFDIELSSELIRGPMSAAAAARLDDLLNDCLPEEAPDGMMMP